MNEVVVLREGYSYETNEGYFRANCTISLVKHAKGNIVVDTGLPCDKLFLCNEILKTGIRMGDVDTVIATHGHSDHVGNLNLFQEDCLIIVGNDISKGDTYVDNLLKQGEEFVLTESISVVPTPGHTCSDISVVVRETKNGTVAIVGDLFECEKDILNENFWRNHSFDINLQQKNRMSIISRCDYVVPGHGSMFKVTDELKMHIFKQGKEEKS